MLVLVAHEIRRGWRMMAKNTGELPIQPSCPGKVEIPTQKELEALNRLREIKEKVREKKKALAQSKTTGQKEKITALEKELSELKLQWDEWEKKRDEAARERMVLLGHEKAEC